MIRDYIQLPLPVRILCAGSLVNRAGSFVLVFLTIYASEQLQYGVPFATACIGVLGLGSMAGSLAGGFLADRLGRRRVMLCSLFGAASLLLLLGVVTERWMFLTLVGIFALVNDLYRPASAAMIADLVPVHRRTHAFALMYISVNLGFAIAPPVGGLLATYSFQWLFWIDAATMTSFGAIILVLIPESHRMYAKQEAFASDGGVVPLDAIAPAPRSGLPRPAVFDFRAFRMIAQDAPFLMFCFATFLICLVFVQGMSTLPIHIRSLGISSVHFGLLMSVNGILIFLLQLPVTHWLSRFNRMTIVTLGGVLIASGFGLTALRPGLGWIAVCIAIWTLGEILQAPFKQAIVSDMATDECRGSYMGMFTMCYSAAMMVGAPLGGWVLDRAGPTILWAGSGIAAMFAVLVYVLIGVKVTERTEDTSGVADDAERTVDVATGQASENAEASEVVSFGST